MTDLSQDPTINVVHNQMKRAIRVLLDNDLLGYAAVLIYSGIDTMAYLGMPESQEDVTRTDFIRWVNAYIEFPCEEQLTGADLYGARCGMLHQYGAASRMSRQGECRMIGYMDKSIPEVRAHPDIPNLVLVSVPALAETFFRGIDRFLINLFSDREQAELAEERFRQIMHRMPAAASHERTTSEPQGNEGGDGA